MLYNMKTRGTAATVGVVATAPPLLAGQPEVQILVTLIRAPTRICESLSATSPELRGQCCIPKSDSGAALAASSFCGDFFFLSSRLITSLAPLGLLIGRLSLWMNESVGGTN